MNVRFLPLSAGPAISLNKTAVLLGRDPGSDIRFKSDTISRRHCRISRKDGRLVIEDLGSRNGVLVNGVKVNKEDLKTGDELTIGEHRYQVHVEGQPALDQVQIATNSEGTHVVNAAETLPTALPEVKPGPSATQRRKCRLLP